APPSAEADAPAPSAVASECDDELAVPPPAVAWLSEVALAEAANVGAIGAVESMSANALVESTSPHFVRLSIKSSSTLFNLGLPKSAELQLNGAEAVSAKWQQGRELWHRLAHVVLRAQRTDIADGQIGGLLRNQAVLLRRPIEEGVERHQGLRRRVGGLQQPAEQQLSLERIGGVQDAFGRRPNAG